jgi:hypothetical protein
LPVALNLPGSHAVPVGRHCVCPASGTVPDGHTVHFDDPAKELTALSAHGVQNCWPLALANVPGTHN